MDWRRGKCTKYFCNLKRRNYNRNLTNSVGVLLTSFQDVMNELFVSCSNLYSSVHQNVDEAIIQEINIPKLSCDDKFKLERDFSSSEIFAAAKMMSKNKTHGIEFYIVFWEDIHDLLSDSYNYSLRKGQLSTSQRNDIISLFLKKIKTI